NLCCKIILIIGIEVILTIVFTLITPSGKNTSTIDVKSIFKGLLERTFLTYSLYSGIPHALTLFGALKLGTRLKMQSEDDIKKESIFNDYYLIGNFMSVGLSIFYYNIIK